jgi:phosphoenolpyruvate carboxykinase (GTP)
MADSWQDPEGVVLDAIVFGGRRRTTVPLVTQAEDWTAGVLMGAAVASEATAAAEGTVGRVRRDPFAMAPFTGYHVGDHWQHWLDVGQRLSPTGQPAVFTVNWFRRDADGRFLWPGFGDNSRVLAWIIGRVTGQADAVSSPVGLLPSPDDLDLTGLELAPGALEELLAVPVEAWQDETAELLQFTETLDGRTPPALLDRLQQRREQLQASD